jgi:acylphosphatase
VQNLADGRVEAVVEGPQDAVEAMIRWCHQGSAAAQVTNVEVEYIQPQALEKFEIR